MFERLFTRPYAVARHRDAPLANARWRYLAHWAEKGMSTFTLKVLAEYLLTVCHYLRLNDRSKRTVSIAAIETAARAWANRRPKPPRMIEKQLTRRRFFRTAKRWLQFLGRLELPAARPHSNVEQVAAFMEDQKERGFSPATIHGRSRVVQRFLDRLCGGGRSLDRLRPADVDAVLSASARENGLKRTSVKTYALFLRTFLHFAERNGWCSKGLAAAIMVPRVYAQEGIPAGPSWADVQRLLATTEGDRPTDIRDRAILMLLMVYGFRSGEVRNLRLDDLDWEREIIRLRRPKQGRTQFFPFSHTVGDAILRYVKEVRPRSSHREIFLTRLAPIQPLRDCALRQVIALRLRSLGISLPHYGPHALRHACATHLLEKGHNLKVIGDYLGHVCPDSTRVYAKVNLSGLRLVADLDLEDLL
jgi:integrase/recombinase XerD